MLNNCQKHSECQGLLILHIPSCIAACRILTVVDLNCYLQVPGPEGSFVFIKDAVYKKPEISLLPFPTYLSKEEEEETLEAQIADEGDVDPFMVAD